MSTIQMPERPVFNSLEPGLDSDLTPPVSSLAVVAMLLGLLSLIAAISVSLAPFAILVAILCALLTWKLSRDSTVSGVRLAQIGLCSAIVGCTWGLTSTRVTEASFYVQAGEFAKIYLQTLSAGKQFDAFELTQTEPNRQVTGTDIEAHYKSLMATSFPARSEGPSESGMPSPETMKNSQAKEELEEFLGNPGTKEIMSHGKDADWKFVRGESVARVSGKEQRVSVVMVDAANPAKKYQVSMNRVIGVYVSQPGKSSVAIWDVDRVKVIKE